MLISNSLDGIRNNFLTWEVGTFAGASLYKCVNRVVGTSLAGGLGIGVHWVAAECGDRFEPIILGISLFLLGKILKNQS